MSPLLLSVSNVTSAHLINVRGLVFVGRGDSNHWIVLDGEEKFGGYMAGIRPMEALLVSLGSCTGMDVAAILGKMGVEYSSFEIEIKGERAEEHPKVYTRIHLKYIFRGKDLPIDKLKRAVELSQTRYCSVTAMLSKAAEITWEIVVEE
ncbi:MAG: osmotically inducible protein OsmC [Thermoplasmata archaeon]|nr:MAG: osmotically inducible protein OsmC [Thermoplasmata archaeon]RLF70176.1 MAG: osmotically inducible protein OsmC [Thermoplasmata archaeon]RLF71629.1 MAG: osmotically inducible protein OsmC [Thermoplasmata archaeon]RLF72771.1 MAG: osmotically inducible protein OsmC [Thermoplasmata archaeon]HDD59631.1 OsmC family peroxiredoxin [Euryarchaeota archaeon]